MIKKTLTFENLDGESVTETFHFHLNKAELAEMQLSEKDGLDTRLREILATGDGALIMSTFKGLMLQTVGRRSEDGKLFRKTQDIRDEFEFSGAYSAMFMEMIENPNAALDFIKGIMPADLVASTDLSEVEKSSIPETFRAPKPLTEEELTAMRGSAKAIEDMTVDELRAALAGRQEL